MESDRLNVNEGVPLVSVSRLRHEPEGHENAGSSAESSFQLLANNLPYTGYAA